MSARATLRLGCPFWSFADWRGSLYPRDARPPDFLAQYGRVFDAVEGNTTFYHAPTPETVARWGEATPDGFRFCFKLPQAITHERGLTGVLPLAESFLDTMAPLGEKLGPFMIQLPRRFGPRELERLERFLDGLPGEFDYAVELRHPDFFDPERPVAARADELLANRGVARVVMDTRPLRAGASDHPDILEARHKKPDLPLHLEYTGEPPLLRVVFHPEADVNEPFLDEWAVRLAGWIARGVSPVFFVHTPSNLRTPELARDLHARVAARVELDALADFPGERGETAQGQLSLL